MSNLRGMRCFPGLALRARAAASRFAAPAPMVQRPSDQWRPILLGWRRRRVRRGPMRVGFGATTTQATWRPQFHLHFSALAGNAWRRTDPSGSTRVTHVRDTRPAVIDLHWPAGRRLALSSQSSAAERSPRFGATPLLLPKTAHATRQLRVRGPWTPVAVTGAASVPGRTRQPLFERTVTAVRRFVRDQRVSPIQGSRFRRRGSAAESPTRLTARSRALPPLAGEGAAYSPQAYRAAEMSWRSASTQPAMRSMNERPHSVSSSPGSDRAHSSDTFPPEAMSTRQEPIAAPLQPQLTAALVDRLTDDVIRRVERRVRIERERRGL